MDNIQILKILKKHHKTFKCFIGCVPSDAIPVSDHYPYGVVVNTDDSTKPGRHWVAIFVPNSQTVEYFDSFAMVPNQNISKYLSKFKYKYENKKELQSILADTCGEFSIYYIVKRCSGHTFEAILNELSKIPDKDKYVREFVRKLSS